MKTRWLPLIAALAAGPALAGDPVVKGVTVEKVGMLWNVHVTLEHPDTGWEHYADGWRVLDEDGKELGRRELLHPHVNEQPFTRSLSGVKIPDGLGTIHVQARCLVDGWSETTVAHSLP